MPEFIYHFSSVHLFIFLCVVLVVFAITLVTLLRRHVSLKFRYQENTGIISCSAFLGVIYAILIGFTILYQFNVFDKADKAEETEGQSLYIIYRNAQELPEPESAKIRNLVVEYAKNAVNYEWPTMDVGLPVDSKGKIIIQNIMHEISDINTSTLTTRAETDALNTIFVTTNTLFQVHNERVFEVHSTLNGHIWFVLLLTTMMTLVINCLLGMDYLLHIVCVTIICVMIAAIMYLIIGLDRPYQGDFVVHPDAIQSTLEYIESSQHL